MFVSVNKKFLLLNVDDEIARVVGDDKYGDLRNRLDDIGLSGVFVE